MNKKNKNKKNLYIKKYKLKTKLRKKLKYKNIDINYDDRTKG